MSAVARTGIERAVARALTCARKSQPCDLPECHAATLERMLAAAHRKIARDRKARIPDYHGVRFRLHRFDGWLIVLTWRGEPVAGPVRIWQEGAA